MIPHKELAKRWQQTYSQHVGDALGFVTTIRREVGDQTQATASADLAAALRLVLQTVPADTHRRAILQLLAADMEQPQIDDLVEPPAIGELRRRLAEVEAQVHQVENTTSRLLQLQDKHAALLAEVRRLEEVRQHWQTKLARVQTE